MDKTGTHGWYKHPVRGNVYKTKAGKEYTQKYVMAVNKFRQNQAAQKNDQKAEEEGMLFIFRCLKLKQNH